MQGALTEPPTGKQVVSGATDPDWSVFQTKSKSVDDQVDCPMYSVPPGCNQYD